MTGMPFRVATWNILGRRVAGTHEVARAGAVRSIIDRHPVDVLCLQEVHFYGDEPDGQLVEELSRAGLGHFVGSPLSKSHLDSSAGLGIGIASATPLSQPVTFQLSNPGLRASVRGEQWVLHDKGLLGCAVQTPDGREIQVYSLHLFPFHEFGVADNDHMVEAMWSEFWNYADKLVDSGELILAGDFNQVSRESAARRWSRNKWQFLLNDLVTTSFGLPLDEIALSWSPVCSGARSVPTFSDHHLAIADVRL